MAVIYIFIYTHVLSYYHCSYRAILEGNLKCVHSLLVKIIISSAVRISSVSQPLLSYKNSVTFQHWSLNLVLFMRGKEVFVGAGGNILEINEKKRQGHKLKKTFRENIASQYEKILCLKF